MDIHVSNLPFKITEEELTSLFAEYGTVESVNIIVDRRNKLKKGFGFVKMPNNTEGQFAILKMNGAEIMGRKLKVSQSLKKNSGSLSVAKNGKSFFKKKPKVVQEIIVYGDTPKPKPQPKKKRRGAGRGTTY
jgi:RNA recognition motif-containing protein